MSKFDDFQQQLTEMKLQGVQTSEMISWLRSMGCETSEADGDKKIPEEVPRYGRKRTAKKRC